jgi:hypothetical protein
VNLEVAFTTARVSLSCLLNWSCSNPNYAIEFVTRQESAKISSVPERFFDEGMVTPISNQKIEETLEITAISWRSRISKAYFGLMFPHKTMFIHFASKNHEVTFP